jgi:hypothetical protein
MAPKFVAITLIGVVCGMTLWMIGSYTYNRNKSLLAPSPCSTEIRHHGANSTTALTKATSTPILSSTTTNDTTINFRLQPKLFIQQMTDCFDDNECRFSYYHFGKSGGTGVAERMEHIFPPILDSCCNARMMQRFHKSPEKHCTIKFSAYEVSSQSFLKDIIPTCARINDSNNSRSVVLVTFREPMARTLSYIHQQCNKNFESRTREQQEACQRCSYRTDTEYWTSFLEGANKQYQGLYQVASAIVPNTRILAIDLVDLSALYRDLYQATRHKAFSMNTKANPEETTLCNFGVTSEMFRALRPANDIYRNLTLGIYNNMIAPGKATPKKEKKKRVAPDETATARTTHILPESCREYVKGHTLDLTHGRYIHVPNRQAPYDHNSCFLMKPRYNCATTNVTTPRAWEYKLILQSDPANTSTICDFENVMGNLGGPAALFHTQVAIFGNSFLRQMFEALACTYPDQLTAAKVTENPPAVSLLALKERKERPYTMQEYGTIINVPVDKRPIPLCAGSAASYTQYFEKGVNLTTPHLTTTCSDELAMLEFGTSLKVFYNFRPNTLNNTLASYQTMIGLNISEMDYIAFNNGEDRHIKRQSRSSLQMHNYGPVLPLLKRIQERDLKRWFGASNPWISSPPDMHPCLPGVPDNEAALFLFSVIFDIHKFQT